jgi:hypothetical protein
MRMSFQVARHRRGGIAAHNDDRILPLPVARTPVRLLEEEGFARRQVVPDDESALRLAVDDVLIRRILCRHETVAAGEVDPIRIVDLTASSPAWPAP